MTRVKYSIVVFLLYGLAAPAHALTASDATAQQAQVIDGHYTVQWNSIPIGRITLTAIQDSDSYMMNVKARTSGVVRWVKKFKRTFRTEGLITGEDPLHPHYEAQRYHYHADYGHKQRSVSLTFDNGTLQNITVTPPDTPDSRDILHPTDATEETRDPLSTLLTMAAQTQVDICVKEAPCSFRVIDGRRLSDWILYRPNLSNETITWGEQDVAVEHYIGYRLPVKGFSEKELSSYREGEPPLHIYMRADAPRLPLRYEIDMPFGKVTAAWESSR